MGGVLTRYVKDVTVSVLMMLIAVIVAFGIEVAFPTAFEIGGPYAVHKPPPPPGTIFSMEEINRGDAEARVKLKQLRELLPPQQLTLAGIMRIALTSQFWVLALSFVAIAHRLRASSAATLIAAIPFVVLAAVGWLTVGQALFFPLVAGIFLFYRLRNTEKAT